MKFQKGHKINKGKKNVLGMRWKIKDTSGYIGNNNAKSGENNIHWKGEIAGKGAMHEWVKKWRGKPMKCEVCGDESKKVYDWANVDHSYKRILDDYIRMCRKCHRKYDKDRGCKIN